MSAGGTRAASTLSTRVLIVGRGPVGMTVALRLAAFGIDCVIADPEGWEAFPGSKALCMQRESMEILERVGCGKAMAKGGVSWPLGRTFYRDKEISQVRFPPFGGLGFPPFVNFAQRDTENLLLDRLREDTRIQKLFGHRLVSLEQDGKGVDAVLEGPDGPVHCRSDYIIGCDGSRSTLRKELGVTFSGTSYTTNFLIFDIRAKLPFANERRLHFDPSFNPGRTVLVHPLPGGDWHIDWQVGGVPLNIESERRSGRADKRIRSMIGDIPYEILWLTTYAFRSLIADRMRVGRAFIAGDAAHLVSPYGARGLNSGLADADNIAWKLAYVLTGRASEKLLDSYHDERHPAADENMRITDKTAQFMAPPTPMKNIKRKLVLATSARLSAARRFVNAGVFYQPATYMAPGAVHDQPANHATMTNLCGAVAPDAACVNVGAADDGTDQSIRLRELIGNEIVVLVVAPSAFTLTESDREVLADWPDDLPAGRVALAAPCWPAESLGEPLPGVLHLVDREGAIVEAYLGGAQASEPMAFLIRPDSYIAAQWQFKNLSALAQWMAFIVGRSPAPSGTIISAGNS